MNSTSSCKTLTNKRPSKRHTMNFLSIKTTTSMRKLLPTRTEKVQACLALRLQIMLMVPPRKTLCKTLKRLLTRVKIMLKMMVKRIIVTKPIQRQSHLMKSWVKLITTKFKSNKMMKSRTPITIKCSSTKCARKSNWTRLKKTKIRSTLMKTTTHLSLGSKMLRKMPAQPLAALS